jgi:competence protein ComEC
MVPGAWPVLALVAGAVCGAITELPATGLRWLLIVLAAVAGTAWRAHRTALTCLALAAAFFAGGAVLASSARDRALRSDLRTALEEYAPGFAIDTLGPSPPHAPIPVQFRLTEDAATGPDATVLRGLVARARLGGRWRATDGGIVLSVSGGEARRRAEGWVAGRLLDAPVTFRRPARYLNDGVPDFERNLALDGTTLFASSKSGLLIEVRAPGTPLQEVAARLRRHVRQTVRRWVGQRDPTSAAVVTAILIGDRTGLPEDVRARLQMAGTYHVIAISGGNIAILTLLSLTALRLGGVVGRPAACATLGLLLAHACVIAAGPSVWRATAMAVLYLLARALDHRSPARQALIGAATLVVCVRPLDAIDVGFLLTCGATAALLGAAARVRRRAWPPAMAWVAASVTSSLTVELALLPVNAWAFSRVTSAGLILNLAAVPLMGIVQVSGLLVVGLDRVDAAANAAGALAHWSTRALLDSARLVEAAPWLTARVAAPSLLLTVGYYLSLALGASRDGRLRAAGAVGLIVSLCAMAGQFRLREPALDLRLTVFDVGQGEASLLRLPGNSTVLVDAGGSPFGAGSFDIGERVVAPALRSHGVRRLDTMLLTHGDPDHIGGAPAIVDIFRPRAVWEGVPVPGHAALQQVLDLARAHGGRVEGRVAGEAWGGAGVRLRVLHPPAAEWERQKVRNDDSVVLEVRFGDVAILLTGDIGSDVERAILPRLTDAPIRVLKVAHHGSRTSSSWELLESWRPQVAVVSAGRGNTFGHPAEAVLQRLAAIAATVYRTDRDGQITLETDGSSLRIRTLAGT